MVASPPYQPHLHSLCSSRLLLQYKPAGTAVSNRLAPNLRPMSPAPRSRVTHTLGATTVPSNQQVVGSDENTASKTRQTSQTADPPNHGTAATITLAGDHTPDRSVQAVTETLTANESTAATRKPAPAEEASFVAAVFPLHRRIRIPLVVYVLVWLAQSSWSTVHAKRVSGDFQLTGGVTEHVLTTFAVQSEAQLRLHLTASTMYEDERALSVFLYRDTEWPQFLKSQLCAPKTRFSQKHESLTFEYGDERTWKTTPLTLNFTNAASLDRKPPNVPATKRSYYWYIVVSDCLLERGNIRVPPLHYEIEVLNRLPPVGNNNNKEPSYTQFSADEMWLYRYHGWTFLVSGSVAVWLCTSILARVMATTSTTGGTVLHVTVLWVTLAALLDTAAAVLELLHLRVYESNGIGSYFVDALSAHTEAVADALSAILLWCVGAGWTLPTEIQTRALHHSASSGGVVALPITHLYHDWRHPFGHGGEGSTGNSSVVGPGHIAMVMVLAANVVLTQWGRTYNDNFDSYHDYEHLPGQLLMWLRLLTGGLFGLCTWQTYQGLQQHSVGRAASDFYRNLLICGLVWYTGLPLLTTFARTLPYHLRNGVVVVGSSLLQSSVLASLAYLVTYSKALAKVNLLANKKNSQTSEMLPTGNLGVSSTRAKSFFSLGSTKIRLD